MDSLLVTPASKAELQLLLALFKKMKVAAQVVPAAASAQPAPTPKTEGLASFIPQNRGEENMLEALLELQEVLAGRKEAMSMEEFWESVNAD